MSTKTICASGHANRRQSCRDCEAAALHDGEHMPSDEKPPDCSACDNSGIVFNPIGERRPCACPRGAKRIDSEGFAFKPDKPGVYDAHEVVIKFEGKPLGFDSFIGQFKPDEPESEDMLEVVALLRQLVEHVGELPARNVTSDIVEVLEAAVCWLDDRDDLEPYDGG